jgi:hypothetical protein
VRIDGCANARPSTARTAANANVIARSRFMVLSPSSEFPAPEGVGRRPEV